MTTQTAGLDGPDLEYHLLELEIARTPGDPRCVMPTLRPTHRRVLDVGCGAGQTLLALSLPDDALGAGVDIDHAALALGRRLDGDGRLCFAAAAGEALPFADATFDLVICRVALPYMHVSRAVASMARVLRPGGDVWLALHPWQFAAKAWLSALRRGSPRAVLGFGHVLASGLALHATGRQFRRPFGSRGYESFQTTHAIRRALLDGGFEDVRVERGRHFVATGRRAP